MTHQGLQLEVRRFCGAPLVKARGQIDGWHNETLSRLLQSFRFKGYDDIVVDLSEVSPVGSDGKEALLSVMRNWHPEMRAHLVASGEVAQTLGSENLPFASHLCSSVELAGEQICRSRRPVTNTVPDSYAWDFEMDLPLAA